MRKTRTAITAPMTSSRHDQAPARRTPRGSEASTGAASPALDSARPSMSRRRFRNRARAGGTDGFCAAGASLSAMPVSLGARPGAS